MALRISLREALKRVKAARTLADIEALFMDAFGLSEAQILGAGKIEGLPDADAPVELAEAAKMANPNYDNGGGYAENCQRCAPAYELLRRGLKVMAQTNPYPNRSGTTKRFSMNGSECFIGAVIHGYRYDSAIPLERRNLIRALNLLPNGARASIFWANPDGLKGHVVVCEKVNGQLVFIDPQTGDIGNFVLGAAQKGRGYFWYRMDNLELNPHFEWDEVVEQ
ncbi:MAG: hypothetical protein K1W05_07015 [Desulfovibrio sp.]